MAASNGFMHHLSMAACEWFVIFLMLLDAAIAFILKKFTHHCELQSPCIFCLRLDHVFANEKPGSYLTLFCNKHRAQVSCLISCELHGQLADVREMCDDCFTSVITHHQSNSGSNGINEDKMGIKGHQEPYLNKNLVRAPSGTGTCSCCDIQWKPKPKPNPRRSIPQSPVRSAIPKLTTKHPSPRIQGRKRNHFKKKNSGYSTPCHFDNNMDMYIDAFSDTDIRFHSDYYSESESDVSFYEYDDTNSETAVLLEKKVSKDDSHVINNKSNKTRVESSHNSVSDPDSPLLISPLSLTSNGSVLQDIDTTPEKKKSTSENSKHSKFEDDEVSTSSDKTDGYKSPGGASSVSEIEGESDVDKLKRQVEYDRERLRVLHTELEEERNAAAIAADEAMAMITRLQEEKAALHMEALQYLRMMDEQAEYDMEALDKANDLVAEKDKEIQDLEAELEYFRCLHDDELFPGNNGKPVINNNKNDLGLEDEKKYILRCLGDLEKKFKELSNGNNVNEKTTTNEVDEVDVYTIENGISDLNERLEALEADRNIIEHACNMAKSNGGLEFIQEIAHQLRDLRKSRFDRSCQSVA